VALLGRSLDEVDLECLLELNESAESFSEIVEMTGRYRFYGLPVETIEVEEATLNSGIRIHDVTSVRAA
jgi:hypothetical protein